MSRDTKEIKIKTFCPECEKETNNDFVCEVYNCDGCCKDYEAYEKPAYMRLQTTIDRLAAELDRYRWHPYPDHKPEVEGLYQITSRENEIYSGFAWDTEFATSDTWNRFVIAFRPMPEAYKPEVKE